VSHLKPPKPNRLQLQFCRTTTHWQKATNGSLRAREEHEILCNANHVRIVLSQKDIHAPHKPEVSSSMFPGLILGSLAYKSAVAGRSINSDSCFTLKHSTIPPCAPSFASHALILVRLSHMTHNAATTQAIHLES
jgi:hypothetical protein